MLRRAIAYTSLVLLLTAPVAASGSRADARAQVEFGITAAMQNLWREAIFRWEKAVEIDPTYAAAFNNLAVAYEHEGMFEKARKAYDKALELDPTFQQPAEGLRRLKAGPAASR